MADSRVSTGLTVEQWDDKFFVEYLTQNRYAGEMGTSENSIIQVKENLTKKPGDRINFALVNKLTQESQLKLQETIQKVINDSNGGLVCIII